MSRIDDILGLTPYLELFVRHVYYSNNKIVKRLVRLINSSYTKLKKYWKTEKKCLNNQAAEHVFNYIRGLGIEKGDILIVHTSQKNIDDAGIDSLELMKFLRKLIGENGTLVLPSYPLYNEKNYDIEKKLYVYDPKKTLCQTGMLPNLFLRMPNVKRSLFPWNTLAAQGPDADDMILHNLETDLSYGPGSAWEYCYQKKAKVLLLGVKASHTTSMVHTAEDLMDEEWPIDGWYEQKKIYIDSDSVKKEISIRLRKMQWAKYNASWYRSAQFKKRGYLVENSICGLNIGYIRNSKEMVDNIMERNRIHRGYFVVPKKYYKKTDG